MPQPRVARGDIGQASSAGELYALCQPSRADGRLSARELARVRAWMDRGHRASVPAADYLRELILYVLATGRAGPAELQALHRVLEPVLPSELRRSRAAAQAVDSEWQAVAQGEQAERLRNEVLKLAHFTVAGCQDARTAAVIERCAKVGDPVLLVRDADSARSPHAIRIRLASGKQIGFVPEQHARNLAPFLDRGARYRAHLTRICIGEHSPVLIVQVSLYPADASLGFGSAGARRIARRTSGKAWWLVRLAVGMLIASSVAVVLRAA